MITFWMQFNKIPANIVSKINSVCANFLWKTKAHRMSWNDVYKAKMEDGLGIRKLDDISKVISTKLVWKFLQGDSLWENCTKNKYCKRSNFWTMQPIVMFLLLGSLF